MPSSHLGFDLPLGLVTFTTSIRYLIRHATFTSSHTVCKAAQLSVARLLADRYNFHELPDRVTWDVVTALCAQLRITSVSSTLTPVSSWSWASIQSGMVQWGGLS